MKQKQVIRLRLAAGLFATALAGTGAYADYPSTVISQGPVGYWQLNETAMPAPSFTTATNRGTLGAAENGTYGGTQGFFRGYPGLLSGDTATLFNGGDESVNAPYNAALNPAAFTVEAWLAPTASTANCPLSCGDFASPRAGWLVYQNGQTGWQFRMYNQNTTTFSLNLNINAHITLGVYQHLVITFDGTTVVGYVNGAAVASGVPVTNGKATAYVPGTAGTFSIGARNDTGFAWAGYASQVAFYGSVLSASDVAAHYGAATTNAVGYAAQIGLNSPLLFLRLDEPGDRPAANSGSLGAAANGAYILGSIPGAAGPRPSALPGFAPGNTGVSFPGTNGGGMVAIPNLNLNSANVTFTAWVNPGADQSATGAGLVFVNGGTTPDTGLATDRNDPLMLAYHWGGNGLAYATPSYLEMNVGEWNFVAVSVQPGSATLYLVNSSFPLGAGVSPMNTANSALAFDALTEIGSNNGNNAFQGAIDEVAIFNRSLTAGEVFTEYAAAKGGVGPQIFADITPPAVSPSSGDPLILTIDVAGTPPLAYQWTFNGSPIPGGTNALFEITNSTPANNGTYGVTVTNSFGSVQGSPTYITVGPSTTPTVVSQNLISRTLYPGGKLNYAVAATGGGIVYQWSKNGSPISGANSSAYTVSSVTSANGGSYTVSLSNTVGKITVGPAIVTIGTVAAGSYEAVILNDSPTAWWRLDEPAGSTNLLDALGHYDGFYTNLTTATPPVTLGVSGALPINDPDPAVSFTGANQSFGYVPYASGLNPKQMTIECWVKVPSASSSFAPISSRLNERGWWWQANGGNWEPLISTGGGDYGTPISTYLGAGDKVLAGQWTHLAVLIDETQNYPYTYYVNGQTDGYSWGLGALAQFNVAGPLIIGAVGNNDTTPVTGFDSGMVDEVAFYSTRLSSSQILSHYQVVATNLPPTFATPWLPQTLTVGRTFTYSSVVNGATPMTFQWYLNGSAIAGATTTAYTITNATAGSAGTYTLWATNKIASASQSVAVTVIPAAGYINATNNLVLHLPFEGSYADTSGLGNDASCPNGTPGFGAGELGQAVHIASNVGTNYLTVADNSGDLTFGAGASFSVALWLRYTTAFGDCPIIGTATNSTFQQGWVLTEDAGHFEVSLADTANNGTYVADPVGSTLINDGAWHNLVAVVDRSSGFATAYVDGLLGAKWSISALGTLEYGYNVTIGQDPTGHYTGSPSASFDLDDVGIWKRPLSATEVAQLYTAGASGHSFNTVAPAPISISIVRSGSNLIINYANGTLLSSPVLGSGAVWTPVAGATSPAYTFTPGSGNLYFRVQE